MFFSDIYEEIISFHNIDTDKKHPIECHGRNVNKKDRCCIFCWKKAPDVSFNKVAHAVSATLGNKILRNHFECDECNKKFGETLEDALAKYLYPLKFVSGCFGRKDTMTIKDSPAKSDDISYGTYRFERSKTSDNPLDNYVITSNPQDYFEKTEDGFVLKIPREKYSPRLVYVAFLKMAYSLIPLESLPDFAQQIYTLGLFVRKECPFDSEEEREKYLASYPNKGLLSFFPGNNPLQGVNIYLYQRKTKEDMLSYPAILFRVDFYNFSITIPVPEDSLRTKFQLFSPYNNPEARIRLIDFTQVEPMFQCSFHAENVGNFIAELPDELRKKRLLK